MNRSRLLKHFVLLSALMTSLSACTREVKFDPVPLLPSISNGTLENDSFSPVIDPDAADNGSGQTIPEFTCRKVQLLEKTDSLTIAARDESGTCFAMKALSAFATSDSSLTSKIDDDALANDHFNGFGSDRERKSFLMDRLHLRFAFQGPRRILLSGAADDRTPILVDNYALVGIAPSSRNLIARDYRAYGTSDAALFRTKGIHFKGQNVPLTAFQGGGTASIQPLDITRYVEPGRDYQLDLRAEDCGGIRQLSEIYILFQ
jgi:hypothetical protein